MKDTARGDKLYPVYLYTAGKLGHDFYQGVHPTDKNAHRLVDGHLKTLKRFNVHLDVVLKR